ncbi:MAG: GFA family protein [Leptothrix sp. (in: b-proteobacteria)]
MQINGKCYCGNISFNLDWPGEQPEIQARACTCTFCRKHGGVWTSNPKAVLAVTVIEPELVSEYEFGTQSAQFHVCTRCGVVPLVTSRIDTHTYAVANVNTFENVEPDQLRLATLEVSSEALDVRLARRKRNWIADVRFLGDKI